MGINLVIAVTDSDWFSRTAVHQSGVTARVTRSPTNPEKDHIRLSILLTWICQADLGELVDEAFALWGEGKFERP